MDGQFYSPAALPTGKEHPLPPVLLNRSLGGPQSRPGRYGEVKILDLAGTRTPTPSVVQPVASQYTIIIIIIIIIIRISLKWESTTRLEYVSVTRSYHTFSHVSSSVSAAQKHTSGHWSILL
jgi:hypothetical protein